MLSFKSLLVYVAKHSELVIMCIYLLLCLIYMQFLSALMTFIVSTFVHIMTPAVIYNKLISHLAEHSQYTRAVSQPADDMNCHASTLSMHAPCLTGGGGGAGGAVQWHVHSTHQLFTYPTCDLMDRSTETLH